MNDAPARIQSAVIEPKSAERAEFCVVKGYVAPTIQFELRLPTRQWSGRYLQGGCGGNCGLIASFLSPRCDMQTAYAGSFAVGFENSGHVGGDGVWALGGQSVREDFAYRAAHAFSIAAKAIIAVYYGRAPDYSYFQGCSDGGREAMVETQRYPADFNGLIAGSPAFAITEAMERFIWEARWGRDDRGALLFDDAAVTLLHDAVIEACDALDGVKDGQLDDPRPCRFDPRSLILPCRAHSPPNCLTASASRVARNSTQVPSMSGGRHLFYGGEPYGSELSWVERFALPVMGGAMFDDVVKNMIFQQSPVNCRSVQSWRFDGATFDELSRRGALFDARSADLLLSQQGGKLILWQGFADPAAGAYGLPDYYYRLRRDSRRSGGSTQLCAECFSYPASIIAPAATCRTRKTCWAHWSIGSSWGTNRISHGHGIAERWESCANVRCSPIPLKPATGGGRHQ